MANDSEISEKIDHLVAVYHWSRYEACDFNKGCMMREHYKPKPRLNPWADYALAIFIGLTLAYLLFIYL